MSTLVLLRHGESAWNAEGRFTGWVDVGLSETGAREATAGGDLLRGSGLTPDIVHTSVLTRAIETAQLALAAADLLWLPVSRSWRLNERHYGALQGKNKAQTRQEFGDEQFMLWRRSYDVPPPPIADDHPLSQAHDPRYAQLPPELLPRSECLKDVLHRLLPYWYDRLVPDLAAGRTPLVVAHGNSLRALVKHLDGISDTEIAGLNIPTGIPLVYELSPISGRSRRVASTSTRRRRLRPRPRSVTRDADRSGRPAARCRAGCGRAKPILSISIIRMNR